MRAFPFEPFNERGGFRGDGAQLATVGARFGSERVESIAAIAQGPFQQRVHGHLPARGMRKVVEARGDLLGAAGEFAARERFQHQRGNEAIAEDGDFSGFVVGHRVRFSPEPERTAAGGGSPCKCCVGTLRRGRRRERSRRDGRWEPAKAATPTGVGGGWRTGNGERGSSRLLRAWRGRVG